MPAPRGSGGCKELAHGLAAGLSAAARAEAEPPSAPDLGLQGSGPARCPQTYEPSSLTAGGGCSSWPSSVLGRHAGLVHGARAQCSAQTL